MAEQENQPSTSEQNHRNAIDSLLGEKPETPIAPETPAAPSSEAPPAIPPVVTEDAPPVTPEVPAAELPSTPWTEKITEISNGLVKSEEDFKSVFTQATKATDLESQLQLRNQEIERKNIGTVVMVSPSSEPNPIRYRKGQRVMFDPNAGHKVDFEGKDVFMLVDTDIYCTIKDMPSSSGGS